MALTSVTIENFKCIGDAVTIPIRPITLLFGKNSSGKSTVLQALHYFQDFFSVSPHLEMSGGYNINLRNFPSLVHRHELDREIRIRIEVSDSVNWGCEAVISRKEEQGGYPMLSFFSDGKEMWHLVPETEIKKPSEKKGIANARYEAIAHLLGIEETLFKKKHQKILTGYELIDRVDREMKDIIEEISNVNTVSRMLHLGSFRELPKGPHDYHKPRTSDATEPELLDRLRRWEKGLGAWDALAQDPKLVKKTNHYMQDILKLGYTINPPKSNGEFQLHDANNNIDVGLADVGVGIAQIIPVVVGALDDRSQGWTYRRTDGRIIPLDNRQSREIFAVEQPELHVHPAVQVALGDVFIDGIKNSNRTMLIETHSEHLLLRLLRRVRETTRRSTRRQTIELEQTVHELTPDDLSVVYVRPTPAGVKFTPLTVTNDGDFDAPWPEGFFEERDSEWY